MRLTATLGHLGLPRLLHHRGHGNSVVWIETPREHHPDGSAGLGLERWRAASYRDPWPDRA
jgi:hypothetical protein